MPDISLDGRLPLEPGAYVYLLAEKDALPVLNQFMFNNINDKQFQQMIDKTRFATAAVYVTPDEETGKASSRYRLTAWGSYPASRAKMALGTNKEWKKRRSAVSGANYWYSTRRGLSVAVTPAAALVATAAKSGNEAPDPYSAAPGTELPEDFAAFHKGSILSCWLTNPGPTINLKLLEMKIPIELPAEQILVSLIPADEQAAAEQRTAGNQRTAENQRYVANLQIQVPGVTQARALTVMFALARNFIPSQTDTNNPNALLLSVLFANPPEQDGKNLKITTAPLTVREIALLLKFFSL
jgi:hypothetical protein